MKIERILRINSSEVYNLELLFDKIEFYDLHAFVYSGGRIAADFILDGYYLAVDRKIKSLYDTTIYYKLEREVI